MFFDKVPVTMPVLCVRLFLLVVGFFIVGLLVVVFVLDKKQKTPFLDFVVGCVCVCMFAFCSLFPFLMFCFFCFG